MAGKLREVIEEGGIRARVVGAFRGACSPTPQRRDAMIIQWVHVGPTIVAAFLASLVEFVEALTVMLAAALCAAGVASREARAWPCCWRCSPPFSRIPQGIVQLGLRSLLLPFGMRWWPTFYCRESDRPAQLRGETNRRSGSFIRVEPARPFRLSRHFR